jgi:hypothetical protein
MYVTCDVPSENMDAVDQGGNRLGHQVAYMSGLDLTAQDYGASRAAMAGAVRAAPKSSNEVITFMRNRWNSMVFVQQNIPAKTPGIPSEVRGLILRAHAARPRGPEEQAYVDRLSAFCAFLVKGHSTNDHDEGAALLQVELRSGRRRKHKELYKKAQPGLLAFLTKQAIFKLRSSEKELFLLPEEKSIEIVKQPKDANENASADDPANAASKAASSPPSLTEPARRKKQA